jgi:hypothetical protein
MAGKHMEGTDHDGMGDGYDCPPLAPTRGQALVQGGQICAVGPRGRVGRLYQCGP